MTFRGLILSFKKNYYYGMNVLFFDWVDLGYIKR